MQPDSKTVDLVLQIDTSEDVDNEELEQLARQLRDEIWDMDVESVETVKAGLVPEGAKSVEAVTWGALAVTALPAAIPNLIAFLQAWAMRSQNRTVKIKTQIGERSIEVEYNPKIMSQDELRQLATTLSSALSQGSHEEYFGETHQEDIKNLISHYNRRLQKLKERQAQQGLDTPVHILTEIEDIEAKIEVLQNELTE